MIAYYCDAKDYTKIFISDINGETIFKIGQYGYGGFFESFQPFRSGLCWSPQSDRFLVLTLFDFLKSSLISKMKGNYHENFVH